VTRLAAAVALAASLAPFRLEEPNVSAGNASLLAGDAAGALRAYAAAEAAVGPRPETAFDRGNAFLRMGAAAEARDSFRAALAREPGPLASRAYQNLGSALEALGERDAAIAALRDALARDPGNGDARYNLEVLLRRKREATGPAGQRSDGSRTSRREEGERQGGGGARPRDDGTGAGREPERGRESGAAGRERGPEAESPSKAPSPPAQATGAGRPGDGRRSEISRQDAERILDALRARERMAPPWPARPGEPRRRDVEKDW
jgi:tetratricopeptide (TPR) repeat protein